MAEAEAEPAAWWCRRCGQPVRLIGPEAAEEGFRRAVHAATGREQGPDTHLAAPIGYEPPLWKDARELAAEYGGVFVIGARFDFLHAEWARVPPGAVVPHYEADDKAGMRHRLDAAIDAHRDRGTAVLAAEADR